MMKMRIKNERVQRRKGEGVKFFSFRAVLFLSIAVVGFGCQPNQTVLQDVAPPAPTPLSTVELKKTTVQEDLRDMQTADFDYVLVFRRKDGGVFDDEDRKYLRQNTPIETNRWTKSEDGRAYVAGSGFGFTPEQLEALKKRFVVEDFSKPEVKNAANSNAANVNANANTAANANKK